MKRFCALLLALLLTAGLFAGCNTPAAPAGTGDPGDTVGTEAPPAPTGEAALEDPFFAQAAPTQDNARVFYEIFVGSFSDSDGDGIGDLRGIINRMNYLNDGKDQDGMSLGIEGIWLTPIFQSTTYHKYNVDDYYAIDKDFGTMEDLQELAQLCHERNVKLILDLPINHTGKLNPWFCSFVQAHRNGDTQDPYYNFYSFYTAGEQAPAGRTFAPVTGTDDYYECNFDSGMPELNFDSPDVRQAVLDVAKYYLDLGVDGFRFDAAKYLYFGDNGQNVEFWTWYLHELRTVSPEIYTVAEVWDGDGVTDQYYPALNCFNFTMSQAEGLIAKTAQKGNVDNYVSYVDSYLETVQALNREAMLVPFIANHDTDRAAGFLPDLNRQARVAANLYLLGPGSPFLYYGEELGLRGSRGGANTDANRRLAMVWGDGDTVQDPEGATYSADNQISATAMDQMASPTSLYSYYKRVIAVRKANPEIGRGDYTALSFPDSKAGGFVSTWEGKSVCVLHNTTENVLTLDLSQATDLSFTAVSAVVGMGSATLEGTTVTLEGQTSVVLR